MRIIRLVCGVMNRNLEVKAVMLDPNLATSFEEQFREDVKHSDEVRDNGTFAFMSI